MANETLETPTQTPTRICARSGLRSRISRGNDEELWEAVMQMREQLAQLTAVVSRNTPSPAQPEPGFVNLAANPSKEWVSVRQASYLLNISEKSVRRLISRGLLKPSKALRHIRIHVDEIEAYKLRTV